MATFSIRPAETRDARGIARVHVRGWQAGYAGIVPAAYVATMSVERSTTRWLQGLADPSQPETVVAEDADERVVGFAGFGLNRNELGANVGELQYLYVEPESWGQGIGGALLADAEERLAGGGFERAILWTLEANEPTRRFYEKRGWRFEDVSDTHLSGATVVRYAKEFALT